MSHLHHKVSALVDGELKGNTRTRALAHARSCPACRGEVRQTLALKQRLLGLGAAEPSADLFSSLAQLREGDEPSHPPGERIIDASRRLLVVAGSVSIVLVMLAYAVGGAAPAPQPRVAPPLDEFTADFAALSATSPLSDSAIEALGSRSRSSQRMTRAVFERQGLIDPDVMPRGHGADERAAVMQLKRAVLAPSTVAYSGVREVSELADGSTITARTVVEHAPRQGTSFNGLDDEDEALATFIGQGDPAGAENVAADQLALLVDAYMLTVGGSGVVAGRPATVVSAARAGSLSARFWIDDATGLLLRREVYDAGSMARSSTFVSLRIQTDGFLSHLPPELAVPAATSVSTQFAPTLNDAGWNCPEVLDDFHLTRLRRLATARPTIHASYSDGLSTVSVFEERGRLDSRSLEEFTMSRVGGGVVAQRQGMPTIAVWQSDDTVYTVVTDAPRGLVAGVVAALPHTDPGYRDSSSRLSRGLRRIASLVGAGD